MVDFAYTETMHDIAKLTRSIVDDHLDQARLAEIDALADRFDEPLWGYLTEAGLVSAAVAEDQSGDGLDRPEIAAAQIELGRALAPVPYLETVTAARAVGLQACAGVATVALDAELDRDPASSGPTALHGRARLVPYGGVAEVVLVADDEHVWLVRTDADEVTVTRQELVDGRTAVDLELAGARAEPVPTVTPAWLADELALGRCAHQLGVTERALELTAAYASSREQFGRPIGSFQAVTHRLADCYIDVEALRLTLWQAVLSGEPTDIATARYTAAETGHRVAHAAIHVHGGAGVDTDNAVHRYFLAAKRNEFAVGSATASLVELGELLAR